MSSGKELMASFEDQDWNQRRQSLEQVVTDSATALMAHTEAAGMALEKDGISVQISLIAYDGATT